MKLLTPIIAACIVLASCSSGKKTANEGNTTKLNNLTDSVSYALGVLYGNGLKDQGFEDINTDIMAAVMTQAIKGEIADSAFLIEKQACNGIVNNYFVKKQEMVAAKNLADGEAFLAKNKTEKGVVTTASGLQYKVLKEGTGATPTPSSSVTVHYTGKLIDGRVFDSSVERGEPISFAVGGVIAGWTEGLQLMKEGAKYMFYIPANLAYGSRGAQGSIIGPNAALIFEVELIKVD